MPSIEEARTYQFDAEEDAFREAGRSRVVAGGPRAVKKRLLDLLEASGADELMAMTGIHDHEERKRSYSRLATALEVGH